MDDFAGFQVMWPGEMSSHKQCGLEPIVADRIHLVGDCFDRWRTLMTEVTALPFVGRRMGSNLPAAGSAREHGSRGFDFEGVEAVEIVVPDFYSAALLVGCAASSFWSEIVSGSGWIVRFEPWTARRDWVVELLSLVERRLKSVPLPSAEMLCAVPCIATEV